MAEAATLAKVSIYKMMEYVEKEKIQPPPYWQQANFGLNLEGITEEYLRNKNYPKMALNTGPYLFESLSFLESIIKEIEPYPGLDIGYRAHEIIESAYHSSRENQIVSFKL